jgi:tRNA modification GTPase
VRTLYSPLEKHAKTGTAPEILDSEALVLYFPAPKTVTGEDILELHIHGGPATVKAVLAAIPQCLASSANTTSPTSLIRYAEAGEFTKRAFMNNRLDLTQVEALGDVLAANTEQQRRLSVRGTTGTLAKQYEAWRTSLLYARGELEALIDFSEDQHFDESSAVLAWNVARQVDELVGKMEAHISNAVRGELLRNGISIALLGAPNAGKSSLLNRIVGREAAIVSQEAGTTRDIVDVSLDLGGYLVRIGDMAGLRSFSSTKNKKRAELIGIVEEEGIKRAKARALESDVVICVFHISRDTARKGKNDIVLDPDVLATAKECLNKGIKVLAVVNKIDLVKDMSVAKDLVGWATKVFKGTVLEGQPVYLTSCLEQRGDGTGLFVKGLEKTFGEMTAALSPEGDSTNASVWQESLGASERHRLLLEQCLDYLKQFLAEVPATSPETREYRLEAASRAEDLYVMAEPHDDEGGKGGDKGEGEDIDVVLAAESLRSAADCLARITGRGVAGDVEEVLGVVFEKFCVGK